MKLTEEQRKAIEHKGHAVITACPGSGKTRTIIGKVLSCIDELSATPRKLACITYTNTAVHEIEKRILASGSSSDHDCYEVSTIHSFCQNNILGKYYWMTEDYKDGYTVLPSDHDVYSQIVQDITARYGLSDFASSQFESLGRKVDGTPISSVIPKEAALAFWDELEQQGYIDFCNIVYHSYNLVLNHPSIAHNLSCRFAYVMVDEFQDTSALQVELLKLIHDVGHTVFFLVGDPEQSIYSFAGAQRELMGDFSHTIGASEFPISGNFRSTQPLVDMAERLITRVPKMVSVSSKSPLNPSIFHKHTQDSFAAISDYFLPFLDSNSIAYGSAAILAQNWYVLRTLGKQLRDFGVPVVGPGARPYKRKYLLGRIAEQVCAYLDTRSPETLRQTEKELFMIANELTGKPVFKIFSYHGMRIVQRLIHQGEVIREEHQGAIDWLTNAADDFEVILIEEGIIPKRYKGCLSESCMGMISEMKAQNIDTQNMELSELGILADYKNSMKLMTMHNSKGREFEAVAIIAAHDGLIPYHNYYNQLTEAGLEEARRLFYVAMTRAERALWIFSSNNPKQLPPTRFISDLGLGIT
jgi:DNA helicase-2/ATP-dependent DNA helicase PcrA